MSNSTSDDPSAAGRGVLFGASDRVFLAVDIPSDIAQVLSSDLRVVAVRAQEFGQLGLCGSKISAAACPLISDQSDAALVIEELETIGYRGVLMVIAPPLPNPGMVQSELQGQAHRVKVMLINP